MDRMHEMDATRTTDGTLPPVASVAAPLWRLSIAANCDGMRQRASGRATGIKRAVINLQHKKELSAT
jgi:hypothetical protein